MAALLLTSVVLFLDESSQLISCVIFKRWTQGNLRRTRFPNSVLILYFDIDPIHFAWKYFPGELLSTKMSKSCEELITLL